MKMNKSTLATILGVAGLSLLKKVHGSKNNEKPFTFTMTFYLEGEDGVLRKDNYENNIVHPDWLQGVDNFILGTKYFLANAENDDPTNMLLEYRQDLQDENPDATGEVIDRWLTDYVYETGEWEAYANTIEDVAVRWYKPDQTKILKEYSQRKIDHLMFTYNFDLDEMNFFIKRFTKHRKPSVNVSLREMIEWSLGMVIEDWVVSIGYYGWLNSDFDSESIREAEVNITDTKLEVNLDNVEPSKRKLVEVMVKEEQKSELRKF